MNIYTDIIYKEFFSIRSFLIVALLKNHFCKSRRSCLLLNNLSTSTSAVRTCKGSNADNAILACLKYKKDSLKKESIRRYHEAEIYRGKYALGLSVLGTSKYDALNVYASVRS